MNIKIREAEIEDISVLSGLCAVLGFEGDNSSLIKRVSEIQSLDYHKLLVAEDKMGNVTGFVHFFVAPSLLTEKTVEIGGLAVFDEYQKFGFGTALMKAAEQWSITKGCESILLATNELREGSIKFYEKIGYKKEFKTYFMRKSIDGSSNYKIL
ncbi:MAG: GNAT family N-acetyltransferase [Oligoflexales bacterium]|nr:GNAT family N-acetyltransferase [Oligoflexales bacterium]